MLLTYFVGTYVVGERGRRVFLTWTLQKDRGTVLLESAWPEGSTKSAGGGGHFFDTARVRSQKKLISDLRLTQTIFREESARFPRKTRRMVHDDGDGGNGGGGGGASDRARKEKARVRQQLAQARRLRRILDAPPDPELLRERAKGHIRK